MKEIADFHIRPAHVDDVPIILQLIRDLQRTSAHRRKSPRRKNSSSMFCSVDDRRRKCFWRLKET